MFTKKVYYLVAFIALLSLVKLDYRFEEIPYGLEVDDAEYYYNAVTIGVDFDLDYSNQMAGIENRYLNAKNKKIVPFHPIGSGILAAPFVILGNILSSALPRGGLISYVYFLYSIAPIFYLYATLKFTQISLKKLNIGYENNLLILLFFGTGISYYAFDRFSMSHVYEMFATAALIYLSTSALRLGSKNKNLIHFSIGILIFVFLSIRWVNYFLFFVPALMFLINNKSPKKLYLNSYFIIGNLIGLAGFLIHTNYLYGVYTLNQASIVMIVESSFQQNYLRFFDINMFFENILFFLKSIQIILFSQEFGLFYFAPILFLSAIFVFLFLIQKEYQLSTLLILIYIMPLLSVIIIQNTAFSYGYRYLYALIPINVIIYFKYFGKSKLLKNYLYLFSLLGFILYIFFETSQATSLSSEYLINSFGMNTRYSNPNYLTNLIHPLTNIQAYLHIVFTSFFGVGVIKLINLFIDPIEFLGNYTDINYQIIELVENSILFSWGKLFIIYLLLFLFAISIKENS